MTRPNGWRRFLDVALVALFCFLAYVLVEAGYRWFQYRAILDHLVDSVLVQTPTDGQGSFVPDAHTGYRYRPNMEVGPAATPFPVHYRTNAHGLIARENFPLAKPAGEFRIGVIGDSFTANVTSTLRWTDIAEDALNASEAWKEITGGRTTRVINFGLDGIGVAQFGAVAETLALPFELDLLIVNMIKDDLIRKPVARGQSAVPARAVVRDHVRRLVMGRLDWYAPYPEVVAVIAGPYLGLAPHLTLAQVEAAFERDFYYAGADDALAASQAAIEIILDCFPDAIFLLDTTYGEYAGFAQSKPAARLADEVFARLRERLPSIRWSSVIADEHVPRSRVALDAWFNVPLDQHRSDAGVRVYGEAVAAFLVERR